MTLYLHMCQNVHCNLLQKNFSIQKCPLYKGPLLEKYSECYFIFEGVDRGGGGTGIRGAESGVEGAGSGDRGGGESGKIGAGN